MPAFRAARCVVPLVLLSRASAPAAELRPAYVDDGRRLLNESGSADAAHQVAHDSHDAGHGSGGGDADENGITIAFMLFGSVCFYMALFYLVNWHDKDIRMCSWKIISATISIFCAVVTFSAVDHIITEGWEEELAPKICSEFLLFFALWFIAQWFLYCFRHNPFPLKALGTIGGHMVGFSAIDAFGMVQSMEPFKHSALLASLPLLVLALCVAPILTRLSQWLRRRLAEARAYHRVDEDRERWEEECEDAENDALTLPISYLLAGVTKCLILHEVPPVYHSPHGSTPREAGMLVGAGVFYLLLLAFSTVILHDRGASKRKHKLRCDHRAVHIFMHMLGLSMSWCVLEGGKLALQGTSLKKSPMLKSLIVALFCSVLAILMIFVLDALADGKLMHPKALRGAIVALSLLVSLAWEKCFHYAMNDATTGIGVEQRNLAKLLISLSVVAIVLPAWRLYILPYSDHHLMRIYQHGNPDVRPPPLVSLCCGRTWKVSSGSDLPILDRPNGEPLPGEDAVLRSGETFTVEQERIIRIGTDDLLYLKLHRREGWVRAAACILCEGSVGEQSDSAASSEASGGSSDSETSADVHMAAW